MIRRLDAETWRRLLPGTTRSGRALDAPRPHAGISGWEVAAFVLVLLFLLAGAALAEPSSPPAEGWRIQEAPGEAP